MGWMALVIISTAALLMGVGLVLMLDAGVHLARLLGADDRPQPRREATQGQHLRHAA